MPYWKKLLLITAGWLAVILGVMGIFLPILPTTPFLILAASCFAKSSERFYTWLINSPLLGPIILDWQKNRVVSGRTKLWSLTVIVMTFSISIMVVPLVWGKVILGVLMLCCIIGVYRAPGPRPF